MNLKKKCGDCFQRTSFVFVSYRPVSYLSPTAPELHFLSAAENYPVTPQRSSFKGPDSSVGRATDWKSVCRWFNSTSGHQHYQRFTEFIIFEKSICLHFCLHSAIQSLGYGCSSLQSFFARKVRIVLWTCRIFCPRVTYVNKTLSFLNEINCVATKKRYERISKLYSESKSLLI